MPKTALMGSPLAVIGTVFRHRRTLAKTGAAVGGVLMLPILFLVMLPGLVFGDLSENTGALTSNTVISENIRASNQAIVEVLQESHDALLAKINAEIARLPEGDTASISDPYASSIIVNANQLIAQFCASQDDYKNINISKLKSLIRENEDGLFSYDVTSETATVEVPAEEENAPPRKVTFTRHTYTVSYAGDAYFADHVFHLTDKQKKTADSYVENLTMFFGGSASGLAMAVGVSDEVLAYRATIQQVAQKYGMEAYVELLMAVMMQESGGRGSDPMQAAEGGFNKKYPHVPNGITDPAYSIECGIQELKYALDKAGCTGPTDLDRIKLALQGYNYGSGYIDWAMERDGGYTKENAIAYSDMMCARPNWHYDRYGDKEYVEHVLRYYQITNTGGSYPANGMQIPHYLQTDYGNIPYGGGSIASSGCGPTSFAMIASYLHREYHYPSGCGGMVREFLLQGRELEPTGATFRLQPVISAVAASHRPAMPIRYFRHSPKAVRSSPLSGQDFSPAADTSSYSEVLRQTARYWSMIPMTVTQRTYINREFDMMSEIHATANAYWIFDKK